VEPPDEAPKKLSGVAALAARRKAATSGAVPPLALVEPSPSPAPKKLSGLAALAARGKSQRAAV
jgi:hypothetical protein